MVRIGLLVVALGVTASFAGLGVWQLDRAEQKRTISAEFQARFGAAEIDLNFDPADARVALPGYQTVAAGRYRGATILLDNQVHRGGVGYLVYTVFELNGGEQSVLVNRGWISAGPDRRRVPEIATPQVAQQLKGRLSAPPQGGLRLAGSDDIESFGADLWRVQGIDFDALAGVIGAELLPITVLLDEDAPHGFIRAWTPPGGASGKLKGESRHLGYAFQWFALALTVVIVAGVLTLRRGKTTP